MIQTCEIDVLISLSQWASQILLSFKEHPEVTSVGVCRRPVRPIDKSFHRWKLLRNGPCFWLYRSMQRALEGHFRGCSSRRSGVHSIFAVVPLLWLSVALSLCVLLSFCLGQHLFILLPCRSLMFVLLHNEVMSSSRLASQEVCWLVLYFWRSSSAHESLWLPEWGSLCSGPCDVFREDVTGCVSEQQMAGFQEVNLCAFMNLCVCRYARTG